MGPCVGPDLNWLSTYTPLTYYLLVALGGWWEASHVGQLFEPVEQLLAATGLVCPVDPKSHKRSVASVIADMKTHVPDQLAQLPPAPMLGPVRFKVRIWLYGWGLGLPGTTAKLIGEAARENKGCQFSYLYGKH